MTHAIAVSPELQAVLGKYGRGEKLTDEEWKKVVGHAISAASQKKSQEPEITTCGKCGSDLRQAVSSLCRGKYRFRAECSKPGCNEIFLLADHIVDRLPGRQEAIDNFMKKFTAPFTI